MKVNLYCRAVSKNGTEVYEGFYLSPFRKVVMPFFCYELGEKPLSVSGCYYNLFDVEYTVAGLFNGVPLMQSVFALDRLRNPVWKFFRTYKGNVINGVTGEVLKNVAWYQSEWGKRKL